jgi:hypothetical protein
VVVEEQFDSPWVPGSNWMFLSGTSLSTSWNGDGVVRVHGIFIDSGAGTGHCGVYYPGLEGTYPDSNYGMYTLMRVNDGLDQLCLCGSWSRIEMAHFCNVPESDINATICAARYLGDCGWMMKVTNPPGTTIFYPPAEASFFQEGIWVHGIVEVADDTARCYVSGDGEDWICVGPAVGIPIHSNQLEVKVELWNPDHVTPYHYDVEWDFVRLYSFPDDVPTAIPMAGRSGSSWSQVKLLFR